VDIGVSLISYKAGPAGSHLTGNENEFRKTIGNLTNDESSPTF